MNARPIVGILLLLAGVLGFLLGRITAGDTSLHVRTPEAMANALRSVFVDKDPMLRARNMQRLVAQLDEKTLPGAIEVFREFSTRAETLGVSEFFARWARIDVEGLREAMSTWPDEKARAQGTAWVAYQYAFGGGTVKAAPFYEALVPRMRLVTGYRLIEGALNRGDDAGLIDWIGSLDDAAERSRLTQSIVLKLLRERDSGSVVAFFDGVPTAAPNDYKKQVFLVTLDKLVRHDVESALSFRDARAAEPYAENSLTQLMVAWADVDPTAALAWIETQPEAPERDRALEAFIDRWATHDEAAAIEWARSQSASPMIDRLCRRFVGSSTIKDPALAMEMAGRIVNPEMKHAALRGFARYWFTRDPVGTRGWLVSGGLSASEAEAMIAELTTTREQRLDRARRAPSQG